MRLRARLPVLWLGPTRVQVGTDPRWSVALHDLSPSATQALLAVPQGADERVIRTAMRQQDVSADEADAVVGHLRAAARDRKSVVEGKSVYVGGGRVN